MEFDYYSPPETFVVRTADQFVVRDDGLLEQQKQDSHVCRRNGTFPLIISLTSTFESLYGGQFTLSTQLIKPNYLIGFNAAHLSNYLLNIIGKPINCTIRKKQYDGSL